MDIDQIIDLWRGLSPQLARAIPSQELPKDEHTDGEKSDEDSGDKKVDPSENHHEESDV
mgnify:CR=1 FL=1